MLKNQLLKLYCTSPKIVWMRLNLIYTWVYVFLIVSKVANPYNLFEKHILIDVSAAFIKKKLTK